MLAFEFDVMGGVFPLYHVSTGRFFLDNTRKEYWLQIVEIFMLVVSYASGFLYVLRLLAYMDAMNTFNIFGHGRYIDFQTVFYRNFDFSICMGFLGALSIFKMLKVVTFNPFLMIFIKTFEIAKKSFFGFLLMSAILILGLTFSGLVIFGQHLYGFMSLDRSFLSLIFFILGEPFFDSIVDVHGVLARVFFFVTFLITQYFILNFFVSILSEGLSLAMCLEYRQEKATIRYLMDTFLLFIGIIPKRGGNNY
ncbi:unnamed protein product [Lymnaea stagnalis]|uniref:Polycystin cation channel PKD1/PKD2 domain-containing protein n=1 Tax=Lymnaea stagnalis TaxID=6523 RepID=A0AAV2HHD3_LYMST